MRGACRFKPLMDIAATIILWTYFLFGYLLGFAPFLLAAFLFASQREAAFQAINSRFYRVFFYLLCRIIPGVKLSIAPEVLQVKSSVIVANHLSYLDPLLLMAIFRRHTTVVKKDFFAIPVFGWILKTSGYLPSQTGGRLTGLILARMRAMKDYLASGGNLFIFPEGTRSRDGRLGPFRKGAFSIAKNCRAPLVVLSIQNTHLVFPPARKLFVTCTPITLHVTLLATLNPDYDAPDFSTTALMDHVRQLLGG